ncbi:uncharacterized protein LOC125810323 [Solanum verrucosum]|uniref:uncharacterized protein LOC125810323 n=1 Tax=Solanum verrucosum TaxID=315347 RepID=UPI0020D0E589|nr:uncharacterized protein LOC125810323 [Solanum verrucosum]
MKKYFTPISKSSLASHSHSQSNQEENVNHSEVPSHSSQEFDLSTLKFDPGERTPILNYHPNHRDVIRGAYLVNGPCQPRLEVHEYPQTNISGAMRRFNHEWFDDVYHDWLEYSVSKDAAYCLYCYLFKDHNINQGGGEVFSCTRFKNWNKKSGLDKHIGLQNSPHNRSKKKCQDLLRQQQSIQSAFERQSNQIKHGYYIRLSVSVDVVRLLITQGLAFRGHDESKSSLSRGNFLQILSWYAKRCDKIRDYVLEHAPQNDQMTSPIIQKDIVTACKIETVKAILEELNGDYFALLVDESFDISRKEQMAIVLRYVDRMGFVMVRLIDIIHIQDTSALSLKETIINLLAQHSLSPSRVRGQCYDGASNMQGEVNGLKMLIRQESRSAYSIYCFAHQLQLTLVGISKKCVEVGKLVVLVSNIFNVLGSSFKRMDDLRDSQKAAIQDALDMGELTTGRGLNQQLDLSRACDTRWGSHYKSFNNFILMFGSIVEVLESLALDAQSMDERAKAMGHLESCQTIEVAFMLHLMRDVLAITNELNKCLQRKEQDVANAMLLDEVAKKRLQVLRDDEWNSLIAKVSIFCTKHEILIPNFEEPYVSSLRSRRRLAHYTVLHHYRVEVFWNIIDWQLQELNDRFNEVSIDLLHGIACLNPINSFSSFDSKKIMRMAELYPDDFDEFNMDTLENQLVSYIIDVRDVDERFSDLNGLCDLSKRLVQTKKHSNYPLVFHLVKLALLLPVATASVERAFSAMKFIKNDLRSQMSDDFFSGCLVPFVEKDVFDSIPNDAIIKTFQDMKLRRVQL